MVLLCLIIYASAVYFTQLVAEYRTSNLQSGEHPDAQLMVRFGGLSRSMLSLFQGMSGGVDWFELSDPLIEHISAVQGVAFCCYIAFTVFALTNAVTGVFVEGALKLAKEEEESLMMQGLRSLLADCDQELTGRITTNQFRLIFTSQRMQGQLKKMDVNVSEAASLFGLLDGDGVGTIGYNEFVGGCMRLRKAAKSIDVITVMHEARELSHLVGAFIERADQNFSKLNALGDHIWRQAPSQELAKPAGDSDQDFRL